jgi:hypothetical protein
MSVDTINSLENGVAFGRLAMIIHLKIVIQNPLYGRYFTLLHPKNSENRTKVRIFVETKES